MIRAKATINGVISRQASIRQDKDGRQLVSFSVKLSVPGSRNNMPGKEVYVSVSIPATGFDTQLITIGTRIETSGTLTFKKQGENVYLNFLAETISLNPASDKDCIEGTLEFKGTVGKAVETKKDKKERPYVSFSAFSTDKIKDAFEFLWVRFVRFGYEPEPFLQPKAKVLISGKLFITAYDGRLSLDCQAEDIKPWERLPFNPDTNNHPPF